PADNHNVCGGGSHASGLALLEGSPVRLSRAQWVLLETSMWVNIQRITGVAHCANVAWPDLGPAPGTASPARTATPPAVPAPPRSTRAPGRAAGDSPCGPLA